MHSSLRFGNMAAFEGFDVIAEVRRRVGVRGVFMKNSIDFICHVVFEKFIVP